MSKTISRLWLLYPLLLCLALACGLAPAMAFASQADGPMLKAQEDVSGDPGATEDDAETNEIDAPVTTPPAVGSTQVVDGSTYQVTSNDPKTVTFAKSKNAKSITVPDTVTIGGETYLVTEIAPKAFAPAKKKLTKVKIGKNITVIGTSAFAGCAKLTSVTGGSAVTIIKAKAFLGCKKLKKCAPFSSKVLVKVGKKAFKGTKKLKKLTVKSKLLKKKAVKGSLKGSSVKTIKVKVGAKKLNKQFAKKYKKIFKKKNSGKKVKVKK